MNTSFTLSDIIPPVYIFAAQSRLERICLAGLVAAWAWFGYYYAVWASRQNQEYKPKGDFVQQVQGEWKPLIYVGRAEYDNSLQHRVEEILQAFSRDWQGKRVLLKPNMLAAHAPEKAVTTHPLLLKYVLEALHSCGAEVMVGDNPGVGGYGRSQNAARKTGLLEAAGECFVHLGRNPVRVQGQSRYFQTISISREVLEADLVINLPKLKTHCLTVLTGAVKNTFGYVVGADKLRMHANCPSPRDFAQALLDVYLLRPPELNIMDAVWAMQGNGPSNGKAVHLGLILAAENAVSLDCTAVHILGRRIREIPHLELAAAQGLGEGDPARMQIQGQLQKIQDFRFPQTFVPGLAGLVMNRCFSRWANPLPKVVRDKCTSCGLCAEHCPVGAMQMWGAGPVLDQERCISCYCCQEMCPKDAISFSGRLLDFLRRE
ncbi:MAG: DUF362 domain-containing protein [Thermodesulfobacteriota bacterium]